MDLTLFGTNQEEVLLIFVEVEAHSASETVDKGLLFGVSKLLFFVNNKLKFHDFLRFELILHQVPKGDATIRRDRVEAEILALGIILPTYLPHWVSVLIGPHSGLVDGSVGGLLTDIEYHDGTVITASGNKCGTSWVEVNRHNARVSRKRILRPRWVLNRKAAD